jgi:DNA-binding GntR family transcriptional regulator
LVNDVIPRASLTDRAYNVIREWVLDGKIAPGERVTVRPISRELELSPTPVNAALSRLAREGILEARLHRGFFVPDLSVDDMREIYEVRQGLDVVAVTRLCGAANVEEIVQQLGESCDRQEQFWEAGDIDSYRLEDLKFHQDIWKLSGNKRLLRAGENMLDQMRLGNAVSARRPGRIPQSIFEHRQIVALIAQGKPDAAGQAIKSHLLLTAKMFAGDLDGYGRVPGSTQPRNTASKMNASVG